MWQVDITDRLLCDSGVYYPSDAGRRCNPQIQGYDQYLCALFQATVLPVRVVPVTSVVTVLRHGERRVARVLLAEGWTPIEIADLAAYVTEERNPDNRRGVRAAEVFLPHALLAAGLCCVDTPGLGSTFDENTAATLAFVPQIDAGAEPPISGEELRLLGDLAQRSVPLLLVLKAFPAGGRRVGPGPPARRRRPAV